MSLTILYIKISKFLTLQKSSEKTAPSTSTNWKTTPTHSSNHYYNLTEIEESKETGHQI
jgi:hypothetical protein